jgi:hypothetical protein
VLPVSDLCSLAQVLVWFPPLRVRSSGSFSVLAPAQGHRFSFSIFSSGSRTACRCRSGIFSVLVSARLSVEHSSQRRQRPPPLISFPGFCRRLFHLVQLIPAHVQGSQQVPAQTFFSALRAGVRARFLFCSIFLCLFLPVTSSAQGFCCRLLFLHQGARFLQFAPDQPARAHGCRYSAGVFPVLVPLVRSAWCPKPAVIRSSAARVVVFCDEIFGQESLLLCVGGSGQRQGVSILIFAVQVLAVLFVLCS